MMLKDQAYGPNAVSRGNGKTRIITLRNPGWNGAYASLRVNGHPVGSPQRAKAYPANPWETGNGHPDANFSYFFPVTEAMIGKTIDAVVMHLNPKATRRFRSVNSPRKSGSPPIRFLMW
jgi:hypothetical protein